MVAGSAFVNLGAINITPTVTTPTTIPCHCHAEGDVSASQSGVPLGAPSSFGSCAMMMSKPTPLRYALTTGYGMYLISLPSPTAPKVICSAAVSSATIASISGDRLGRDAAPHELDGERREHGGGGRAGRRDEPVRPAEHGRDEPERRGAEDSRDRTLRRVAAAERREDRDAERDSRGKRDEHGGHAAPDVAGEVAGLLHHAQKCACTEANRNRYIRPRNRPLAAHGGLHVLSAIILRRLPVIAIATLLLLVVPVVASAQTFDSSAFAGMRWREIGPYRGGRSVAVTGSSKRPLEYWMGTTGGGVFKTTDGGMNWGPATDRYFGGTIGALAQSESNPDIVWAGGGESDIRGNTAPGDGVWMTKDDGRTWGLIESCDVKDHVNRIRIHPTNPDIVWIGVLGHAFGPNPQRGVFKTTDGGKSWRRVLYRDDQTGISDLVLDPTNPDVIYAAFWHAYRTPWSLESGGPGGGIFKSTDGGETWKELTANAGLPKGLWGKVGLAVSGAKSSRVWALIEADSGGVYRSDDGGATWARLNDERKLRQRAWYYSRIYADPRDTNVGYALNTGVYRSTDGGKTFPQPLNPPHGDNHDLWIAPNDPDRMVNANDGGANVSMTYGRTWTPQSFA